MGKFLVMLIAGAIGVALLLPLIALLSAVNGWVLSVLWNWFIPVIFEGAPRLGIGAAMAVALIVRMLTFQIQRNSKEGKDERQTTMIGELLMPFVMLTMGAIIHWWFF